MTSTDLVFARASLRERMDWSKAIAAAGDLVPKGFRNEDGTPNAAKVLLAAEYAAMLGEHPLVGLTSINVIEGKPTPSPALMSALIRKAGHKLRVRQEGTVEGGDFKVTVTLIRADDPEAPFVSVWTPQRAARAGLCKYAKDPKTGVWKVEARSKYGKPLPWENFTEDLCKRRGISEVGRDGAEDALLGAHYTAEEIGAVVDENGEVIREDLIEDAEIVEDTPTESTTTPVAPKVEKRARQRDAARTASDRESTANPGQDVGRSRPQEAAAGPTIPDTVTADEWTERIHAETRIGRPGLYALHDEADTAGVLGFENRVGRTVESVFVKRRDELQAPPVMEARPVDEDDYSLIEPTF